MKGSSSKKACLAYTTAPTPLHHTTYTRKPTPPLILYSISFLSLVGLAGVDRMHPSQGWCVAKLAVAQCKFRARRRTLGGDRACGKALTVASCDFLNSPTNPPRGSCVSKLNALAVPPCEFSTLRTNPLAVSGAWQRWRVEHPENSVWNRRPSRCFRRVAALARGVS